MTDQCTSYVLKGAIPLLAASIIWGVSYFIRKMIVADIGPFAIVFLYSIAAAIFLFVTGPARYRGLFNRTRKNWKLFFIMSFLSVTLGGALMNVGLKNIDLGVGCLLERMQIVFTVIIAALFLCERLTRWSVLLSVIAFIAGLFLLPQRGAAIHEQNVLGVIGVVGAAFIWAISSVLGRKAAKSHKALDMAMFRALIGITTSLPLMLFFEPQSLPALLQTKVLFLTGLGGILASGIGYGAYYYGLKIISASVASMIEISTPLTAVILGLFFLGEQISGMQVIAAIVLLVSLTALIWIEARQHQPVAEAMV